LLFDTRTFSIGPSKVQILSGRFSKTLAHACSKAIAPRKHRTACPDDSFGVRGLRSHRMAALLIVDGLPVSFSQKRLEELCADLIGVSAPRIITDPAGHGLGFAYIEVELGHVAQTIKALEGRRVGSKPLVVRIVEDPAVARRPER
jgi:hypothetical protein